MCSWKNANRIIEWFKQHVSVNFCCCTPLCRDLRRSVSCTERKFSIICLLINLDIISSWCTWLGHWNLNICTRSRQLKVLYLQCIAKIVPKFKCKIVWILSKNWLQFHSIGLMSNCQEFGKWFLMLVWWIQFFFQRQRKAWVDKWRSCGTGCAHHFYRQVTHHFYAECHSGRQRHLILCFNFPT